MNFVDWDLTHPIVLLLFSALVLSLSKHKKSGHIRNLHGNRFFRVQTRASSSSMCCFNLLSYLRFNKMEAHSFSTPKSKVNEIINPHHQKSFFFSHLLICCPPFQINEKRKSFFIFLGQNLLIWFWPKMEQKSSILKKKTLQHSLANEIITL